MLKAHLCRTVRSLRFVEADESSSDLIQIEGLCKRGMRLAIVTYLCVADAERFRCIA